MALYAGAPLFASSTYPRYYPQVDPVPNVLIGTLSLTHPRLVSPPDLPMVYSIAGNDFHTLETVVYMPVAPPGTLQTRNATFAPGFTAPNLQVDQPPNLLITLAAIQPFPPPPLQGRTEQYHHWTFPYVNQDFYWSGVSTRGIPPPPPFQARDLGTPMPAPLSPQDFEWGGFTTRGIPTAAIHLPFKGMIEQPTPMPAPIAQADSYSQPHVLQVLVIKPPFSQHDFPLILPATFFTEGLPSLNRYPFLPPPTVLVYIPLGLAIQILATAGFTVHPTIIWQYSTTVPYYDVISQFPLAGTVIPYQSIPVQLTASAGPPPPGLSPFAVPNVQGMTLMAALNLINAEPLNLGTVSYIQSASYPVNTVVSQFPLPGSIVYPYSGITLVVCSGPLQDTLFDDLYTVPNVSSDIVI